VADALLGGRDFAASLRAFVRRHPRRGYGGMFLAWALADDAPPYGSWGNGAPMRVAAIGWLAESEAEALALAAAQAAVSHDHPDAIMAAQAVALAVFLARSGLPCAALRRLSTDFGYDLAPERALGGGFDVSAAGTAPPALAALHEQDWEDAVRRAVCRGGDTDTLAAIAGRDLRQPPRRLEEMTPGLSPPAISRRLWRGQASARSRIIANARDHQNKSEMMSAPCRPRWVRDRIDHLSRAWAWSAGIRRDAARCGRSTMMARDDLPAARDRSYNQRMRRVTAVRNRRRRRQRSRPAAARTGERSRGIARPDYEMSCGTDGACHRQTINKLLKVH
jgi:hypothetical protein